ncbi:MAG: alpha/beta hydrolase, partial [Actinomycetota bacterium]|nr:alpha/beta hydrolase [Actinomycetota bacterium]
GLAELPPRLVLAVVDGVASATESGHDHPFIDGGGGGQVTIEAASDIWSALLAAVPPAQCNDLASARHRGLKIRGDQEAYAQHYGAISRAIDLLRQSRHGRPVSAGPYVSRHLGPVDAPIGRYYHVELGVGADRVDHRLYVETAGQGVPLLLQHTAGAHGAQWRHLFEDPWITDHFQLVAYDLPFHGKSLPPTGRAWWSEPYRLTTESLMSIPLAVADALALDRPVFMGCSIGGLLALDLARYHPDRFRAVIGVEPALKAEGNYEALTHLWHPRIDSAYKAALMEGLTAPQSPEALRKETAFVYSQGWPAAFLGDLYFYIVDHDLRTEAAAIDTSKVAVHLLSGEYDWSATPEAGRSAHEAIPGSTWTLMEGVGHFPMSENPEVFLEYLKPVLEDVLVG